MKRPRRVVVTVELDTTMPLKELREHALWTPDLSLVYPWDVRQVSVNVVSQRASKPRTATKTKRKA